MFSKSMFGFVLVASLAATSFAVAQTDEESVLERNRAIELMKDKEAKLKLQAEMSKHYKQMEEAGFFVDETGAPLGVPDITSLARDIRASGGSKAEQKNSDPFAGLGPVIPREALFGDNPLPTLGEMQQRSMPQNNQQSTGNDSQGQDGEFRLKLVEIGANSIIVDTNSGYMELRNGQKVGDYKLSRFDIDRAFFVDGDGRTRVVSIDWTASKRYADD